jgi:hypothetical protein
MFAVTSWTVRLVVLPLALLLGLLVLPAAQAAAVPGDTEIEARWVALQGTPGDLGPKLAAPNDKPRDVRNSQDVLLGRVQDFTAGSIFWSSGTGAWDVRGAFRDRYLAGGGPAGTLGFPQGAAAGIATGGEQQVFSGGRIYWSAATGAHALQGAVLARYLAGGTAALLKLPTTDETAVTGGSRTVFQGGHIYRSSVGARVVSGATLARYLALGGSTGVLGLPTSEEVAAQVAGARVTVFAKGRIYWSSATGARAVYGGILAKYLAMSGERAYLGLPKSSVYAVRGGHRVSFIYGYITQLTGKPAVVTGYWRASVRTITASEIPYTYRSGCPVGPASLRRVKMPYYDWAGVPRLGDLIVRTSAADDMQRVFKRAFNARFPIRQIRPVDVWKGSDIAAMAADNTSAFNCRKVTGNPYRLSQHSYGHAIDINTVENPYVTATQVYPAGSRTYLNRRWVRKGMIVSSGPIAAGMRAEGWPWGARWSYPDYQHFSANGG